MELSQAMNFLAPRHQGVVITLKRDGRPQASNILYAVMDGDVRISVTASRAKTRNLRRDARASLHVTSDDFWSWVVLEALASFSHVAAAPGDAACQALRDVYEAVRGEPHPDWDDFDRAMVDQERCVLSLAPERAYGTVRSA